MKLNIYIIIIFCALSTSFCFGQENHLIINLKDGNSEKIKISGIKKMNFSSGTLYVNCLNSNGSVFRVDDIDYMHFQTTSNLVENELNQHLLIYPNPTQGLIYLKNISGAINTLNIYMLNGKLIYQAKISSAVESLDLAFLPGGLYILKLNNEIVKLVKL